MSKRYHRFLSMNEFTLIKLTRFRKTLNAINLLSKAMEINDVPDSDPPLWSVTTGKGTYIENYLNE